MTANGVKLEKGFWGPVLKCCVLVSVIWSAESLADTFRIELDYMGADSDGHDHRPSQQVLDAVIQMFACQGHILFIDLDDEVPHYDELTGDPNDDCSGFFSYTGADNTYASIRETYRDRGDGWHYALFAHQWSRGSTAENNEQDGCYATCSSGLASGGDAFVVTLGCWSGQTGSLFEQAALLAHEFGHNLGLTHCGANDCGDTTPYVMNLPSVMSYTYALRGVRSGMLDLGLIPEEAKFNDLDYSHGRMCALDENDLNENLGTIMMPVDFNCDDSAMNGSVQQDLGFQGVGIGAGAPWCGQADASRTVVEDYDEWANIEDGAGLAASGAESDHQKLQLRKERLRRSPCITKQDHDRVVEAARYAQGASLSVECFWGDNIYVTNSGPTGSGICGSPYSGIGAAQSAAPDGSVYFLRPGVYDEVGTTVLDKPGTYVCNTGGATIE